MIEIDSLNTDWIAIRQALSLALLNNRDISLLHAGRFLTDHGEYRHVLDDLSRVAIQIGAGRISCENDSIRYFPRSVSPGKYNIESGSWSSSVEILLFLMPALFFTDFRTVINATGVTHSVLSHPTAFIKEFLLAALEKLGFFASLTLKRFGFYGSGGGTFESRIYPQEAKQGPVVTGMACAFSGATIYLSRLNMELAEMEKRALAGSLGIGTEKISIIEVIDSDGPGNSIHAYANRGGSAIIFYREIKVCDEGGAMTFNEEEIMRVLHGLSDDVVSCRRDGALPDHYIRELYPYIVFSGSDPGRLQETPAAESVRNLMTRIL